jgi:hypothetical protein
LLVINSVREAITIIPVLKELGVNTVSFGPDIATRDVETPRAVGTNLTKFYIKIFENAGFNVHLVPNSMHWRNNQARLENLTDIVIEWANISQELDVRFYTVLNEVDGHENNISETNVWLQSILPLIREKYSGIVCVQPTQKGFLDVDTPHS